MKKIYSIFLTLIFTACLCFVTACNNTQDPPPNEPKPYEVPIVRINTNGAEITSKEDYVDMTFSIEKVDNELKGVTGGIRLRGNSTKGLPKKPYRIKFDEKQSLFGLEKAKSWVLLAEYKDPSAMHNFTAFTIAKQMPGLAFTPTPNKVDVFLNGEYAGLYTLCEQVQENKGRMDIEMDEITADMHELKDFNFFISMDKSAASDETAVLNETYFYIEEYDRYFELKYPEKGDFVSDEQFQNFFSQLVAYTKELMDAFATCDESYIRSETNVESLIDYLLVDQMMGEYDHMWKSFNMYYTNTSSDKENGKINFGPVWDYDWCLHTSYSDGPNLEYTVKDTLAFSNVFFKAIDDIPSLYSELKQRYVDYGKSALQNAINVNNELIPKLENSLQNNHNLWYTELPSDATSRNITFLNDFLKRRLYVFSYKYEI